MMRIALYVGDEMYPSGGVDVRATIADLQASPLTSPILSLVNQSADDPSLIVYNEASSPLFDDTGAYRGSPDWAADVAALRGGGSVQEVHLSFSTSGTCFLASLLAKDPSAANRILSYLRDVLGFDGIDLDYEGGELGPGSPIYAVAGAAFQAGLRISAAPYGAKTEWQAWVQTLQQAGATISCLNVQCYSGGAENNPGDWVDIGVPIVAGSFPNDPDCPQSCQPLDVESLYSYWRLGAPNPPGVCCWYGPPNTGPQAIGGGFFWAYSNVKGDTFLAFMQAMKNGLGST